MAPHSSILAWRIPWTEEPGGLQSVGSQRVDTTERLHLFFLFPLTDVHSSQLGWASSTLTPVVLDSNATGCCSWAHLLPPPSAAGTAFLLQVLYPISFVTISLFAVEGMFPW